MTGQTTPATRPGNWKSAFTEPKQCDDVGSPIQTGDAWFVRFLNEHFADAVVDVHVYAVASGGENGAPVGRVRALGVQVRFEFCITSDLADPWTGEQWSQSACAWLPGSAVNLDAAKTIAKQVGEWYAAGLLRPPMWDGKPWADDGDRLRR